MKVGFIAEWFGRQSLKKVFTEIEGALAVKYDIVSRPLEHFYSSPRKQQELNEHFLRRCDVTVGQLDDKILRVRERIGGRPPLIGFLLGTMSSGGFGLIRTVGHLTSADVLIVNCAGDLEIARKFFTNAQLHYLPFPFEESVFFPADEFTWHRARLSSHTAAPAGSI